MILDQSAYILTDKKRDLEVLDVFVDLLNDPFNLTLDFLIV